MRIRLIATVLVLSALAAVPALAQQSWVQRCTQLPRNAEPGLVEFCKGILANNGYQGPQDHEAAIRHYRRAAELGYAEAQAILGVAYERGYESIRPDLA